MRSFKHMIIFDRLWLVSSFSIFSIFVTQYVCAQSIKIDNTTPTQPENCFGSCTISGGVQHGQNLFHSFTQFNVGSGYTVLFSDPGVTNILARVTGTSQSNILGTIGTSGGEANLFLLNPNGILFGPNAKLNLGGSFVATTANSIQFGDQGFFSALTPKIPSLKVNPSALLFTRRSGTITTRSRIQVGKDLSNENVFGLKVPKDRSLLLVGSELIIDGNEVKNKDDKILAPGGGLHAFGGRLEVGGLSEPGVISLTMNKNILSLGFPKNVAKANVSILNGAKLNVTADNGGEIAINAKNLSISNRSTLRAGIAQNVGFPSAQAGDIKVHATGTVTLTNSFIYNSVRINGTGHGGDIRILSGNISLNDMSEISTATFGKGDSGNISLQSSGQISLANTSFVGSSVEADIFNPDMMEFVAIGNGGDIEVLAKGISLDDSSNIATFGLGLGKVGNVDLKSIGNIFLTSDARIGSTVFAKNREILSQSRDPAVLAAINNPEFLSSINTSSKVTINTRSLTLTDGGQIANFATGIGVGSGGDIIINASDFVDISGFSQKGANFTRESGLPNGTGFSSGLFTFAREFTIGSAGNITVKTGDFFISDGSAVSAQTFNKEVGGDISISANNLIATNGGQIRTTASNTGSAGNITLKVRDNIKFSGSDPNFQKRLTILQAGLPFFEFVTPEEVDTEISFLRKIGPRTGLFASNFGRGKGGDIKIFSSLFQISNSAVVDVRTTADGEGGNIFLKANSFNANSGGQLVSTTEGSKPAGNITLEVLDFITLDGKNSGFFANTTEDSTGPGGNINIDPRLVLIQNGAEITVNSRGSGLGGNISLQSGNLTLDRGTISATSTSSRGGNIDLNIANLLLLKNNSRISASAGNQNTGGDGGNVIIDTDLLVALQNSDITANAFTGRGGNIQITSRGVFLSPDSDITASSERGIDGTVEINNPEVDPSESLTELPESVDPPQEIAKGCRPGQTLGNSSFIHVGRGGLPLGPHQTQTPTTVWQDLRAHNLQPTPTATTETSSSSLTPNLSPSIIEAKGWTKDPQGRIYLTASVPQPAQTSQPTVTC